MGVRLFYVEGWMVGQTDIRNLGHFLQNAKGTGEAIKTDSMVASEWVKSVWVECNRCYSEEDIYNADKTGLCYNVTNNLTFKFKTKR
jgi:hypothetical protein